MRARFSILAGFLSLCGLLACSDNPNQVKTLGDGRPMVIVTPTETLDQSVATILALFPRGLQSAAISRWDNVKRKYAAGQSDAAQLSTAKEMLFELSDWVNQKSSEMSAPPNNETRTAASARAVLYMSMYIYTGPATTPPPFTPSADAVVGLVTPGSLATIVTPTKHAGVQLEAGSVAENTIVVVTQNPTPYPANCSGPLQTRLCQYPQFYTFDQFPHVRLLKPAKFNVCHVNSGENRRPLADHDRFRLAHAKPFDPADYTPGSTIRDQNGESIEILPLVAQTFSTCVENFYASAEVGSALGSLSKFAQRIKKILSPKPAYAIDLGLGGLSVDFSPFNDVDPLGIPDRSVQSFSATPVCGPLDCLLRAGGHVGISYAVANIGTATGTDVAAAIRMISVPPNPEDPAIPIEVSLGSVTIPTLVPGKTVNASNVDFVVPATLSPGNYTIRLSVGDELTFPEPSSTLSDNVATVPASLAPTESLLPVVRVCPTGAVDGPPTVPNLTRAMQLVASGGTVRICDGTFAVFDIDLNTKSMTIEGEGPGRPTLDAGDHTTVFYMDSPTPISTSVILRRLRLQNGEFGPLNVSHHHAWLTIDDVEFHAPNGPINPNGIPDAGYLAGVGIFNSTGQEYVWVLNSTFIGGDIGVHMNNAANVVIENNTFRGQLNAAIHGGNGGNFWALSNTITNCGHHWCVGIFSNGVAGDFRLINNTFTVNIAQPTDAVIALNHGIYEVRGNVINGVGGSRDPTSSATWPINNAISINDNSTAEVSFNRVRGAYVGFNFVSGTSVTGTDNVVTEVSQGIHAFFVNDVAITRSDFTFYTTALDTDATRAIAYCNWWGSPAGPQGVASWINPITYGNWAASPIANQAAVNCGL